ncbi:hypothetical protein U5U50_02805 [Mycoplasma sp. 888]|nr:hypothetical protein [Mycoplasma sp. 888]WRQ25710.1 hypothetical protein U5U50_02805 [Mycoplasma sp. 888]
MLKQSLKDGSKNGSSIAFILFWNLSALFLNELIFSYSSSLLILTLNGFANCVFRKSKTFLCGENTAFFPVSPVFPLRIPSRSISASMNKLLGFVFGYSLSKYFVLPVLFFQK